MEYKSIPYLAKCYHNKKLLLRRKGWGSNSYCIVNNVSKGKVYGHIHYGNNHKLHGIIPHANEEEWIVIKRLDEDFKYQKATDKKPKK